MRCFIALDLPEAVRQSLGRTAAALREVSRSVRPTSPEQMHVTLKFLGDVDQGAVAAMSTAVRMLEPRALRFSLQGLGRFPPHGPPRVLWAGLQGDTALLATLAGQLEEAAQRCGVPREDRPFHAHVTLARVKFADRARELTSRLEELSADVVSEPFAAPSVTLYRSELDPRGARYSVLERKDLPAG